MTSSKLLLINPPFPRKVAGVPLQLLYLAAAVKDAGSEVRLLDLDIEPDEKRMSILEQRLRDYRPTHVGVTAYSPNYPESLDIMRAVKEVNPSITVISGGPHQIIVGDITPKPEFIDHVVAETFGETALSEILGLERRILDRSTLFPAFELLKDSPRYHFDSELFEGRRMTQIITATGCNQRCNFCSAQLEYTPFENKVVLRQLKQVVDLGYQALFFNDPNFTNPFRGTTSDIYSRVKSLMQAIVESGLSQELIWGCQTKASMVNPSILDAMTEAGCRYITFALENIDAASLNDMVKGITPKIVKRAIELSRERGIKTGLYVMFGTNPNQEKDFGIACQTLDFVEHLRPDYLSISVLAQYPMFDRSRHGERLHMELDYANKRYSREPVWLAFDEGWGAYHPYTTTKQAQRYLIEIERRKSLKPNIWDPNVKGAIRRF